MMESWTPTLTLRELQIGRGCVRGERRDGGGG